MYMYKNIVLDTLKELFLNELLPERKLRTFSQVTFFKLFYAKYCNTFSRKP